MIRDGICDVCTRWFCDDPLCGRKVKMKAYMKAYRPVYYRNVEKPKRKRRGPTDEQIKKDLYEILVKLAEGREPDSIESFETVEG